jgi:hypothetical protein
MVNIGKGMLSMWSMHYVAVLLKKFLDKDLQLILDFIVYTQNNRKKT